MDIVVRYWDVNDNIVKSRYLTSVFMQHATALDILAKFKEGITPITLNNIQQVSMDGPNVNWCFLDHLKQDGARTMELLELGSCGLHIVHGALQTGHKASQWKINDTLRGLYWLFKDSPARRADYTNITGSTLFPKKFCATRWVESSVAANRALDIFDNVCKYVMSKDAKLPINISTSNVKRACEDKLIKAKFAFFATIASSMEPFLTKYQTAKPMVPFKYGDLEELFRSLICRFVKVSVANTDLRALVKVDFYKKNNLKPAKDVDIGFSARKYFSDSAATEKQKLEFLIECQKILQSVVKKLLERSALKYTLTRAVTCFSPTQIVSSETTAQSRMKNLLQILHDKSIINSVTAERAQTQYGQFIKDEANLNSCKKFSVSQHRLDVFYREMLMENSTYFELWEVLKHILILSHGNATVEAGFSINKHILVENIHEESVVAQRQVYDAVLSAGGVLNVNIDQKMRNYVKSSYRRYTEALEKKKQEVTAVSEAIKEREMAKAKIHKLEEKKRLLNNQVSYESGVIDREISDLRKKL